MLVCAEHQKNQCLESDQIKKVPKICLFIRKARSLSSPERNFGAAATQKMMTKKEKDNIVRTNEGAVYNSVENQRNNSRWDRDQIVANMK